MITIVLCNKMHKEKEKNGCFYCFTKKGNKDHPRILVTKHRQTQNDNALVHHYILLYRRPLSSLNEMKDYVYDND